MRIGRNRVLVGMISMAFLGGCGMSDQTRNLALGGTVGAVTGGALGNAIGGRSGNDRTGAVVGAVVGAGLGALIGQRLSQQKDELEQVSGVEKVTYDQDKQQLDSRMQVLFDSDKSAIKPSERAKLDELAKVFANYPENIVVIEGHTDSDGPAAYNQQLSEQRAAAIASYLRSKQLDIASLNYVGHGESRPVGSNTSTAGKAQNRRVEIKISVDQSRLAQVQANPAKQSAQVPPAQ